MEQSEKSFVDLRSTLNQYANDHELTRQRRMQLVEEKAVVLEQDAALAHSKIHELYEVADHTISYLVDRVGALEEAEAKEEKGQFVHPNGPNNLVPAKHMVPAKLSKVEDGGLCRGKLV